MVTVRKVLSGICIAIALSAIGRVRAADAPAPRLAVILVVDQMRADYIERFGGDWTSGLHRLVTEGARFTEAAYPYLATFTCVGHATIGSGALPYRHGMIQNMWYDRVRGRMIRCTEDESVSAISYGEKQGEKASAGMLMVPTFADRMRDQKQARVVSLSLKARAAIMLAGHGGDVITWRPEAGDTWQTSSAFAPGPVPEVRDFIKAHPVEADYGRTWERFLPPARYSSRDDASGEKPLKGWTGSFPHVLRGDADDTRPDEEFYLQWERSPFGDAYLSQFAQGLVERMRLGQNGTTDVLAVSFSSPDLVGHLFGPDSQEIQDIYARLDRQIGALLETLDRSVGRGQYVVALSADHGVTEIPAQLKAAGKDAGVLSSPTIRDAVQLHLQTVLGPGQHVARVNANDIYLATGVYAKLAGMRGALDGVLDGLKAMPGIQAAFTGDELLAGRGAPDPLLRAAALSYVPGRSGDLVIAPRPGWVFTLDATSHGSANRDDQHVPIILFGYGVKSGLYAQPATPADIAPTLAQLCGITLPDVDGRSLTAALK
jgi:predicted AlkP superfamily pyrophosphatase or phosphodiesterase